jgi:hypothetical protein
VLNVVWYSANFVDELSALFWFAKINVKKEFCQKFKPGSYLDSPVQNRSYRIKFQFQPSVSEIDKNWDPQTKFKLSCFLNVEGICRFHTFNRPRSPLGRVEV